MDAENPQHLENHIRLQLLLNKTATSFLRQWFRSKWQERFQHKEWENSPESGANFIQSIGKDFYKDCKAIQQSRLKDGNISNWDLPLLVKAIISLEQTKSKKTKEQKNNEKLFEKLVQARNELAHSGKMEIDNAKFKSMWETISKTLLSLGIEQKELDAAKIEKPFEKREAPFDTKLKINNEKATTLKAQGNELFNQQKFKEAIKIYSEAIKLPLLSDDELAVLFSNRSISYLKLNDLPNAKNDAKAITHLRPTWFKGYTRLADVYIQLKKYDKALQYSDIAFWLLPSNLEIKDTRDYCRHMVAKLRREEHTDPLNFIDTFKETADSINKKHDKPVTNARKVEATQKLNYEMGLPVGICGEGHNYLHGRGVQQNCERAAKMFAKAASLGNAEGMYNLAMLTKAGTGVQRNVQQAMQLLFQAAEQDPIIKTEVGIMMPNIGVNAAQHALGLSYEEGSGVPRNLGKAVSWYKKALENRCGNAGNNLAILYYTGQLGFPDIDQAFEYWKISAILGTVRSMENLAHNYLPLDISLAQKWYSLAVENGSVSLPLNKSIFMFEEIPLTAFSSKEFIKQVKQEVMTGPFKHLAVPKEGSMEFFTEQMENLMKPKVKPWAVFSSNRETNMILLHREHFHQIKKKGSEGFNFVANPAQLKPKPVEDIFSLKPIHLKDMDKNEDHVYEGFAIKLTLIEDALLGSGRQSVGLIGKDENGDIQRLYVYNYPHNKETEGILGYGSRVTVFNPYFRITIDGSPAIRIDDPTLLFVHSNLKDVKQCRFCTKPKSTVLCRKCRRVYYCSKECLAKDAEEFKHEYVCIKRL